MAYPLPGYLERPADLAGNMLAGFQAGASVARAQAELAQQAQHTEIQLAAQERQAQRDQVRQQQVLEMTKAYHEATLGLRKQQLDDAAKRVNLATTSAARKFQAQQQYDQYATQLIQSGTPETEAYGKAALKFGPMMGMASGPMAAALKPPRTLGDVQASQIPGIPGNILTRPGDNRWQYVAPAKETTISATQLAALAKEIPTLTAEARRGGPDSTAAAILRLAQAQVAGATGKSSSPTAAPGPPVLAPTPGAAGSSTNAPIRILAIRPKSAKPVSDEERAKGIQEAMSRWPGFRGY